MPRFLESSIFAFGDPLAPSITWKGIPHSLIPRYRLYLYNSAGSSILYSSNTEKTTVRTIPEGNMVAGTPYKIQVRARDDDWIAYNNRVRSNKLQLPQPTLVPFDVTPMTCPNTLNTNSSLIGVAILGLGGGTLNVNNINAWSVTIAGASSEGFSIEDIGTPYSPYIGKSETTDCNSSGYDGELDLTLKFKVENIVNGLGSVSNGDVVVIKMHGLLDDGTPFIGEDVVTIEN